VTSLAVPLPGIAGALADVRTAGGAQSVTRTRPPAAGNDHKVTRIRRNRRPLAHRVQDRRVMTNQGESRVRF